jgi:hypothetical protein
MKKGIKNKIDQEKINQAAEQFAEILVALVDEKNSIENKDLLNKSDSYM